MKALVTGGGGFLGGAIVKLLLKNGEKVVTLSRRKYPALDALGVTQYTADLTNLEVIREASKGCDIIFHVAAKAGISLDYKAYYRANVEGTKNIIEACRTNGIRRLVYTSSPSVTFSGEEQNYVDESEPYPETYLSPYSETKAIAEKMVLNSNSQELATVALRPHLIWGPGDNHLIPRIIDRGKRGKLRNIGDGTNLIDSVYIDNAAEAHILAAERLYPGASISGKAYFISQGEPIRSKDLINMILEAANLPPLTKSISPNTAYRLGIILEKIYLLLGLKGEPLMTRFLALQLATNHFFDIGAAKKELGYSPKISIREGMDILKEELSRKG
ncbi:MAG: NAD-dependent epimerase/dehydratase family protein [Nitrospinota bacterium]